MPEVYERIWIKTNHTVQGGITYAEHSTCITHRETFNYSHFTSNIVRVDKQYT